MLSGWINMTDMRSRGEVKKYWGIPLSAAMRRYRWLAGGSKLGVDGARWLDPPRPNSELGDGPLRPLTRYLTTLGTYRRLQHPWIA